jgi:hypothetical protein
MPLTPRSAGFRLQLDARQAGLGRHISLHTLRHSIAVHYLQGGAPVSFVQALLGHASLATTGIYLQLTDPMAQEITQRTETALEPPQRAEATLCELLCEFRALYQVGTAELDAYVEEVLLWLAG